MPEHATRTEDAMSDPSTWLALDYQRVTGTCVQPLRDGVARVAPGGPARPAAGGGDRERRLPGDGRALRPRRRAGAGRHRRGLDPRRLPGRGQGGRAAALTTAPARATPPAGGL